jgi:hypothetical protein
MERLTHTAIPFQVVNMVLRIEQAIRCKTVCPRGLAVRTSAARLKVATYTVCHLSIQTEGFMCLLDRVLPMIFTSNSSMSYSGTAHLHSPS